MVAGSVIAGIAGVVQLPAGERQPGDRRAVQVVDVGELDDSPAQLQCTGVLEGGGDGQRAEAALVEHARAGRYAARRHGEPAPAPTLKPPTPPRRVRWCGCR